MRSALIFIVSTLSGAVATEPLDIRADACFDAVHSGSTAYDYCTSFIRATVASTVVTTTFTSTYIRFNNNKYQPTSTATPIKSLVADKSGRYTVTPTHIPDHISAGPCGSDGDEQKLLSKYSSACSGYGGGPTTVTVSTATVTQLEYLPTTVSDFHLRVKFPNGTEFYAVEDKILGPTPTHFYLHLDQNSADAALFGLDMNSQLRLESQGTFSYYDTSDVYEAFSVRNMYSSARENSYARPIEFKISKSHKDGNITVYPVEVAPMVNGRWDNYNEPRGLTVMVGGRRGLWFGTPSWQDRNFESVNKTSIDGNWSLIDLYAEPLF